MLLLCDCFDWGMFWSAVTAAATILIAVIAGNELSKNRKIKSAEFINEFTSAFFNPKTTSELLMLFEFDLIEFVSRNAEENELKYLPQDFSYFKVTIEGYKRKDDIPGYLLEHKNIYSIYEIEDFLLGHFEDMGLFLKNKVMSQDFIFDVFGFYIVIIGNNRHIQNYICQIRKEYDDYEIFERFEDLIKITPNNKGFTGFEKI